MQLRSAFHFSRHIGCSKLLVSSVSPKLFYLPLDIYGLKWTHCIDGNRSKQNFRNVEYDVLSQSFEYYSKRNRSDKITANIAQTWLIQDNLIIKINLNFSLQQENCSKLVFQLEMIISKIIIELHLIYSFILVKSDLKKLTHLYLRNTFSLQSEKIVMLCYPQ